MSPVNPLKILQILSTLPQTKTAASGDRSSGARRDRTVDLLNAIQALSQLSYSPEKAPEGYHAPPGASTGASGEAANAPA